MLRTNSSDDRPSSANGWLVREQLEKLIAADRLGVAQKSLTDLLTAAGMDFEGRGYSYNPCPVIISGDEAEAIGAACGILVGVLDKIGILYKEDRRLRTYFSNYAAVEHLTLVDVRYRPMAHLNRFDLAWLGGADFKVLETNTCCPAGVTSNAMTRNAWRQVSEFEHFTAGLNIRDYPIDQIGTFSRSLAALSDQHSSDRFVVLANYDGNYTFELDRLKAELEGLSYRAEIADIRAFDYANGKLRLHEEPVSLVYNKLDPLAIRDQGGRLAYFDAYRDRAFVCVNSFRSQFILEDKAILGVMSDQAFQDGFSPQEREAIAKHVPWTALVRGEVIQHPREGKINLLSYIRARQSDLVLKPSNQTRGAGVCIGKKVSAAEWEQRIADAVGGEWVVQDFCRLPQSPSVAPTQSGRFDIVDWQFSVDAFFIHGQFCGLTSRSNNGEIINVGSGGMRTPLLVTAS